MTDEGVAQAIRADRIDVLIDVSGYSREHRLNVLRFRPAPIQIAYPNFPSTRGIPEIEFLLTDRWATPEGTEEQYTETPVRLPSGFAAYAPPPDCPLQSPLPVLHNGYITFGMFQRRVKWNSGVFDAVAGVLHAVPDSRLLIQHIDPFLDQPASPTRSTMLYEFLLRGVSETRLRFAGSRRRPQVMALMAECDIALDSFPFGGHTTTCECLWMGVPVVTLSGATHASRISASILNSIGLPKLAGQSIPEYIEIARRTAAGVPALARLRSGMRRRMRRTGFVGSRRLSSEVETAIRLLWRNWCAMQQTT